MHNDLRDSSLVAWRLDNTMYGRLEIASSESTKTFANVDDDRIGNIFDPLPFVVRVLDLQSCDRLVEEECQTAPVCMSW